jgi:hypothetical protein
MPLRLCIDIRAQHNYSLTVLVVDEVFREQSNTTYHGIEEIFNTSSNMANPYSFKKGEYYYMNNFTIIQWLSESDSLASRQLGDQNLFYIKYNTPPTKNINNALLKYKGTYSYIDALNRKQIIPSFELIDILN